MDAAAGMVTVRSVQNILLGLTALAMTDYRYPASSTLSSDIKCNFTVVGGGTAGAVVASRLSENENITVCLMEAGDNPRLESVLPGTFTLIPLSGVDWNRTSVDDNYTCQYLQDGVVGLTCGKGLGGSGMLHHTINVRGAPADFDTWAKDLDDDQWAFESILSYFKKSENVKDPAILNSPYISYHGTSGNTALTREPSEENVGILKAAAELGNNVILDINANETLGWCEPLLYISPEGYRQSSADAYLSVALNRSNLLVFKNTRVNKILIEDNKAVGVEAETSDGTVYNISTSNEVIVSAGAIHSPQLLQLSGIGPKALLESLSIPVVADLPTGQNYQDHTGTVLMSTLDESSTTPVSNYHQFPVPMTTGYTALDSTQSYPDYQTINLLFPPSSAGLLQLCSNVFKFKDNICQKFYDAGNDKKTLMTVLNQMHPYSRGYIVVNSTDPSAAPLVYTKMYSNNTDLVLMGKYIADFAKIVNTTYFKSVGSEFVDLGLSECADYTFASDEYWECYALQMSSTMWHYSGTCSMGMVVDSDLKVYNVSGLRTVDASVMRTTVSGNINAAIVAIAEKASDLIKDSWNL